MRSITLLFSLALALSGFEFALAAPGNGQCAPMRDYSVTAAPTAFGSAGAEIASFPAAITGVRGGEFFNFSEFNVVVSVSTSASNCTGGRANFMVPANGSIFIAQGDQKFGSKVCVIREDGVAHTVGKFKACVR